MSRGAIVLAALASAVALAAADAGAGPARESSAPPRASILYSGRVLCPFPRDPSRCEGKPLYRGAIYVVAHVGAPSRRITPRRFDDSNPSWSPDRRRIAFVRQRASTAPVEIWVMNADGSGARRVTQGPVDTEPSWSPDGRWIAFRGGTDTFDVFVVRPDGSGRRNVTRNPQGIHALDPTWSRDGIRIAFKRSATPAGTGVYSIGLDGHGLRRLARDGYEPDWSPDGRRIAYVRRDAATGPGWQVYAMRPNGGGKFRVSRGASWVSPTWSPGSRWLAVVRNDRGQQLSVMRADGTGIRVLTTRRTGFAIDGVDW